MRTPGAIAAVGAALALTASAAAGAEPVHPGETLGLVGPNVPAVLKAARSAPYAAPAGQDCDSIAHEIAALDAVLGPDADAPPQKVRTSARAGKLFASTLRGFIPHRDVVRFLTGAGRQEQARNEATMAGWARRGYLKGLEANQGCPGAAAPTALEIPPAPPAEAARPARPILVRGFARPAPVAYDPALAR